jgi:putative membrane protein
MTKRNVSRLCAWAAFAPAIVLAGAARAADSPSTAEVLGKLHQSDQKEIEAGKMAERDGQSPQTKDYGKMLVKDHTEADKKVTALAKQEKINLSAAAPAESGDAMKMAGPDFDRRFAKDMVDDHRKDIAEVTEARDKTTDPKLKKLLSDLLPTLQKHEDKAEKLLNSEPSK